MKIVNETIYQTSDLRKILSRVAQDELDVQQRKRLTVRITYSRKGQLTGYAYYHGRNALLRLPKPPKPLDLPQLAHLIAHEFAHCRGMKHRSMTNTRRYDFGPGWRELYTYAQQFPVRVKEAPKKPTKLTAIAQKLLHAQANLKRNESKLKRQTTITKKWRLKVKYYEKKISQTE